MFSINIGITQAIGIKLVDQVASILGVNHPKSGNSKRKRRYTDLQQRILLTRLIFKFLSTYLTILL